MRRLILLSAALLIIITAGCERETHLEEIYIMDDPGFDAREAYERGDYQKAAELYARAFRNGQNEVYAFNAACSHSLSGNEEAAMEWLRISLRAYFQERFNDFDLDPLRDRPDFRHLEELAAEMHTEPSLNAADEETPEEAGEGTTIDVQ